MIEPPSLAIAFLVISTLTTTTHHVVDGLVNRLDVCMDSDYHKSVPGKEDSLHSECVPWKDHSCCTQETSRNLHDNGHYNFDYNHCSKQTRLNMSAQCFRHFVKDTCFYECEPNIGPWLVRVNRKFARERFVDVPLCFTDCQSWWNDCKDQFTCVYNWPRNFKFRNGRNHCPDGSKCRRFDQIYESAKDFCENVWDKSWKVVPDEEPCMRIWFDGSEGNPNRRVAEFYIDGHFNGANTKHEAISLTNVVHLLELIFSVVVPVYLM